MIEITPELNHLNAPLYFYYWLNKEFEQIEMQISVCIYQYNNNLTGGVLNHNP